MLVRHLSPLAILRDLAVLAALGLLAGFSVLFVSRVPFDNVVYESSLGYQSKAEGRVPGGGLVVASSPDFELSNRAQPTGRRGHSLTATAEIVPTDRYADVQRLFSGIVVSGSTCADGVVIDEASAEYLKASVGGPVVVSWRPTEGDAHQMETTVCGIGRPWHPGGSLGNRGYVIVTSTSAKSAFPGFGDSGVHDTTFWLESDHAGAASKWASVAEVLGNDTGASAFVLIVAAIGAGLWLVGLQRATSGLRGSLGSVVSVVRALGAPATGWLWLYGTAMLLMAAISACVAAILARLVILSWTALYISSSQIVAVVGVLLVVAVAVVVFYGIRAVRSW
ncbi:hypothetical protein [Micropruina sp.]|uniref:hypothetical protein n=1 Tax=Micropruina sp. TaxID=2737536 RepID=UPI0039E38BCB